MSVEKPFTTEDTKEHGGKQDPLQRILYAAWKCSLRRHRREEWEAGKQPDCREHPGVTVDRFHWITSGRLLCRECIKTRNKKGREFAAMQKKATYLTAGTEALESLRGKLGGQ